MANTLLTVPALDGGVSRQTDARRYPNQVSEAENVMFSIRNGMENRPGSTKEFPVQTLAGGTTPVLSASDMAINLVAGTDYREHRINRDSDEQYVVVYGDSTLRVWDTATGTEGTITFSADAQAYFDSGDAGPDDLKLVTIADYTIILNKKVVPTTSNKAQFSVTRTVKNYDTLLSHTLADGQYAKTEEDDEYYPIGYYQYVVSDGLTYPHAEFLIFAGSYDTVTKQTDGTTNDGGMRCQFHKTFMNDTDLAWDASEKTVTKAGAFADYFWESGDYFIKSGGGEGGGTDGPKEIASKVDDDTITLVVEIEAGDAANWETTGIHTGVHDVMWDFQTDGLTTFEEVARGIQEAFATAGFTNALVAYVSEGFNHYQITAPRRGAGLDSNGRMLSLNTSAATYDWFAHLWPFWETGITETAATGTPSSVADYHNSPSDRWRRVAAPGDLNAVIDNDTMPIKMVRTSTSPLEFEVDVIDWKDRLDGNDATNPVPAVFQTGSPLRDVTFLRNRLMIASDEEVKMTQADDFFNFWIEDADNVADADPIGSQLSSNQVTIADYLVPFRKGLTIFTLAGRQFELNAPETLTQSSAAITPSTAYKSLAGVRPVVMANQLYFVSEELNGTQLREYFYSDTSTSNTAENVSKHVGDYLPVNIKTIDVSLNHNVVMLLEKDTPNLYVYRTDWNGNERVQSAWDTYSFHADERVVDFTIIDNEAWNLIEDTDAASARFFFTKLAVAEDAVESGYTTQIRLDNRIALTGGAYAGGVTTWTITGDLDDAYMDTVILEDGTELTATWVSDTSYTTPGDNSGLDGYLGRKYYMEAELSRPYLRREDGTAILDATLQLHSIRVNHTAGSEYTVRVVSDIDQIGSTDIGGGEFARDYAFPLPSNNLIDDAESHQAPVMGLSDNTIVRIRSNSPKPCMISSCEYVVTSTMKSG